MRYVLTVMLVLFMFTTAQVAGAFEVCNDPHCADFSGSMQKKAENSKKDTTAPVHCALGCHQIVAMPDNLSVTPREFVSITAFWTERLMPDSVISESLIEPPSLA